MIKHLIDPSIELHNLTVTYESKPALWNADITFPTRQLVGILGPNGSGKSTMLKAIMGLVEADSGFVKIKGRERELNSREIAYVPQRGSVDWDFPINVYETVLMGRFRPDRLLRRSTKEDRRKAKEALEKVQMEKFAKRQISRLSGGQQQRVFIARALAQEADIYLLDEPFAGVDAATENTIMSLLKSMRDEGKTIIVVHHDLQTVTQYFDWVVMLNTRVVASGPTQEVFSLELLNQTYGGKLQILEQVSELIARQEYPVRENPSTPS